MIRRVRMYTALIVVIAITVSLLFVFLPRQRVLYYNEYTSLESYPDYHYTNFTITEADSNALLSMDFEVDRKNNNTQFITYWLLYQESPVDFEADFNITEAHEAMSAHPMIVIALWGGAASGDYIAIHQDPISSGTYVFVFWIEQSEPKEGWTATLSITLTTSLVSTS